LRGGEGGGRRIEIMAGLELRRREYLLCGERR